MGRLARALAWLSADVAAVVALMCSAGVLVGVGGRAWPLVALVAGAWCVAVVVVGPAIG